uniref:Tetratricopeptide repeat-containing protein n=1 Tax=Candidatus Kentrum sp. TUN TaxID=2126343 RepID=A0A451A4V9_9GAMM|nr:MAG: Tetratricopeptide repeat-containing protein [Candidatus Kentron sp. TUN]
MEISSHIKTQLDRLRAVYPKLKATPDEQLLQMLQAAMQTMNSSTAANKKVEIEEALGKEQVLAVGFGNLGRAYSQQGDLDLAIQMHERALEIHGRIGDQSGCAQDYGNLAICYRQKGDVNRALMFYKRDLEITEEIGDRHSAAISYFNLGLLYFRKIGDYKKARAHFEKAKELFEIAGDAPHAEQVDKALQGL